MVQSARIQPQGLVRLDRSNALTRGALAIISSAQTVNAVSGQKLTVAGSYAKNATPKGIASKFRNNAYLTSETLPAIGAGAFVEFWYGVPIAYTTAGGVPNEDAFLTGSSAADGTGIALAGNRSGVPAANWSVVTAWPNTILDSGEVIPLGVPTIIVRVRRADGSTHDLWRDGRLVKSATIISASVAARKLIVGSFVEDTGYWTSSSDTILAGIVQGEWTAAQVRSFCANPWQLFEAPGQAQLTVATALNAPLTATALAVSSVTAGLTTRAALASSPAAIATATGALTAGARLLASPAARAAATGALSTRAALAASPAALATVTGALSTRAALAASPAALATVTATLPIASPAALQANAAALATASASATVRASLSAAPVGTASATASLTARARLTAAPAAQASATAALSVAAAALAGAAIAQAGATAALTTRASLSASAQANTAASAAATTSILLAAVAASSASASAELTVTHAQGGMHGLFLIF